MLSMPFPMKDKSIMCPFPGVIKFSISKEGRIFILYHTKELKCSKGDTNSRLRGVMVERDWKKAPFPTVKKCVICTNLHIAVLDSRSLSSFIYHFILSNISLSADYDSRQFQRREFSKNWPPFNNITGYECCHVPWIWSVSRLGIETFGHIMNWIRQQWIK